MLFKVVEKEKDVVFEKTVVVDYGHIKVVFRAILSSSSTANPNY